MCFNKRTSLGDGMACTTQRLSISELFEEEGALSHMGQSRTPATVTKQRVYKEQRTTDSAGSRCIGETLRSRSCVVLTLPFFWLKGALIDPSLVEAELADPNWNVDMVEFQPAVDLAICEWSQRVALPSSEGVSTVRSLRMKPGEAAPATSGRINGRHAPTMPSDDSTIGQYTKGVSMSADAVVSFRLLLRRLDVTYR